MPSVNKLQTKHYIIKHWFEEVRDKYGLLIGHAFQRSHVPGDTVTDMSGKIAYTVHPDGSVRHQPLPA